MGVAAPLADLRMVIQPSCSFADISGALESAGFSPGPDDAVTPPAIPGEREFATWTSPDGKASAHYSFNPVVLLRVLSFSGPSATHWIAEIAVRLPRLDANGLSHLLQSLESREVLLGLFAAVELKAFVLIPAVDALRHHADRRIAKAAAQVADKLALSMVEVGGRRLAELQRRHPDRSPLFPLLGDAGARRELLTRLLDQTPTDGSVKILRSGLTDEDWRVRVTAMVVAARLRLAALWPEIRQAELPATGRSGLDRRERSLLMAMRKAILAELACDPLPDGEAGALMLSLRDAVAGRPAGDDGEVSAWVERWLTQVSRGT